MTPGSGPPRFAAPGSPPPGTPNGRLDDDERRRTPAAHRTSHAVYVRHTADATGLRLFTTEGQLPACGHGTVAALALLAARHDGAGPCRAPSVPGDASSPGGPSTTAN
ncbi:hypothetical protein AB0E62_21990 [Streptomyces sp. NPDC038707]|uniref:hypothetical protein n=1 Tax=Streptomyces sp. NPDC038707 TaxID=3154329 RepID=UPI0033FF8F53